MNSALQEISWLATARWWVAVLLVIGLPPAVLWWFLIHPLVDVWRRVGVKTTLAIAAVLYAVTLALLFLVKDWLIGRDLGTSWWSLCVAAVLLILALGIATWRRRHLSMRTLVGIPELEPSGKAGHLLTEGPYALVRNPRYLEIIVGMFAYAFFAGYLGAYLVVLATLPLLHIVVLMEERELERRFGEPYSEYRRAVPRYLPSFRAPRFRAPQ